VAFDQPLLVVGAPEAAYRLPQVFERLEALDPELLERSLDTSAITTLAPIWASLRTVAAPKPPDSLTPNRDRP
jgi:hypothetical protein